jgi:uncharacterized protein
MVNEPAEETPVEPPRERGLHPAVQVGWALRSVVNAVVLGGLSAVLASALAGRLLPVPGRPFLVALAVTAAALPAGLWHARRLFTSWSWALREDDVVASWGVVFRVRRSIPRSRVQHVDLASGPVDRALGLVHVSLHVAGAMGPVLDIPGVAPAEAEALREALLRSARVA